MNNIFRRYFFAQSQRQMNWMIRFSLPSALADGNDDCIQMALAIFWG